MTNFAFAPSVLYVEDDPKSRTVMQILLKNRLGLPNVTIFENSTDFTARVADLDPAPDVIFLDIHMQPHNGFEMLSILRSMDRYAHVPIVALTASVMNEEVQRLKSAGFNGCLAKPLNLATFAEALHQILSGESVWRIMN